jgi:hypothetical protein
MASAKSNGAFLRWVRATHPQVYQSAVRRVASRAGLGGLGDDLLSDVTFDPGSVDLSSDVSSSIDSAVSSQSSGDSFSSILDSLAGAVTSIAPAIVNTQAQLSTIQINAQRAQQGLPPISSTSLLTGQGLGGSTGLILLLGVGVLALVMASKGGSAAKV